MRRTTVIACVVVLACTTIPQSAQQRPDASSALQQHVDSRKDQYIAVARQIWEFAELGYQEERSSALLQKTLGDAGFTVQKGIADMPTGFTATYGSGKPVLVIVGEFDALPGLSQAAGSPDRKPLTEGAPGHGCGHNLFGTASAAAAIAVKDWMIQSKQQGTLRYYGTPAEEGGGGKVYMVRAGLLKDVDAVIGWHPGDTNAVTAGTTLATITASFKFRGTAAHAAAAPDKGRSALDAVESMDYMVNMMREHVPQETRIHYVIRKGGVASNIVPDYAEVEYQARHPDMRVLNGIWERIVNASKGAALGTGTTVENEVVTSYWNVLSNETLAKVQHGNLLKVGGFEYTPDEQAFADKLRATVLGATTPMSAHESVQPLLIGGVGPASTDMGDISWNVPTVQLTAATFVPGVPAHSWQAVACTGMSIGYKGMMVAAKTIALTTAELFQSPATLQAARDELLKKRGADFIYNSIASPKPPLGYRKGS